MLILADILSATILFAVPLLLVALGGMFSERSGVINIALEGIMIVGALMSCLALRALDAAGLGATHPQWAMLLAILVAALSGAVYALLLAFASINLKADQTIGGTALNMLAPAFAITLTWAIQGQGQTTILIPTWTRITQASLGLAETDGFFQQLIFKSCYLTTPIALLLLILSTIIMYKTRLGLRLRSCGEFPQAAASVGINVFKMRYIGVLISGLLGGIGGLAFTVAAGSGFQSSVAGYGFLALAVMIFGNWKPLNILGASLFFAFFKILGSYSSSIPFLPEFSFKSSEYVYLMLPYVVTMIILVLTSKKSRAPKAEGIPYDKGTR
ncbi:MAG TPA: ABC transporter permease [Candidatus Excrementavichristensenella intestinipullorum]|nr:ABC transporter permease [Candidatus Excrementavichristensenella intestinipullorum]